MAGSVSLAFNVLAKNSASKEFDKLAKSTENVGKKAKASGSMFSGLGKTVVGVAAGLGAVSVFKGFIAEAREAAKIGRLTDAVLKSTGGAANVTAKQVEGLATAISNKTGIDDEAVQSASNLLLTFTKVRNEAGKGNDIFNQATQAAVDMSVAMGTDARAASLQLGKALNDPIKGVSALGKAGVSFTQQQKDQIKTLVKSGDVLGAQKIILKEMQTQFGGAAAAAADPMQRLGVVVGNLGEAIGTRMLPFIERGADFLMNKLLPAASQVFGVLFKGDFTGGPFAEDSQFIDGVFKAREALIKMFAYVKTEVLPRLREFGGFLRDDVLPKVIALGKFISKNRDFFIPFVATIVALVAAMRIWVAVQTVLNIVLSANPIGLVVIAIAALVAGLVYAYKNSETFRKVIDTAFKAIGTAASFMWNDVLKPVFKIWLSTWFTIIGALVNGAASAFGWVPGIGGKLEAAAREFNEFRDSVNRSLGGIVDYKKVRIEAEFYGAKGLGAGLAARAGGGPVRAGTPYLVGEREPELFVPNTSGRIYNQRQMAGLRASGGEAGGGEVHLHFHGTVVADLDFDRRVVRAVREATGMRNGDPAALGLRSA